MILLKELANQQHVELLLEIDPHIQTVEADAVRLKQIFFNLLSNGIKFNHPGGRVSVRVYPSLDGQWMMTDIEDTGIGIPGDKISELFSEFYQVDPSSSRQHEGTGLGLALTKRMVELHGGRIHVESQEGIGSTFTFQIPLGVPLRPVNYEKALST